MTKEFWLGKEKENSQPNIHQFKAALKHIEDHEMHNFHRKHRYVDIEDMELTEKLIQKSPIDLRNISSKTLRAEEVTKLMNEILVEQPKEEFNKKHQ